MKTQVKPAVKPASHRKAKKPPSATRVILTVLAVIIGLTVFGVGLNDFLTHVGGSSPAVTAPHHPAPHRAASKPSVKPVTPHRAVQNKPVVHVVQAGDTLWSISAHHYGQGQGWHKLYQMNRHTIGPDPNMIHIGEVLNL